MMGRASLWGLLGALSALGCGGGGARPPTAADGGQGPVPVVVFNDCDPNDNGSAVYDEAYLALLDARSREQVGGPEAPVLLEPSAGAALDASGPAPSVRWSTRAALGSKGPSGHGCTVDGDVYWLRITTSTGEAFDVLNRDTGWTSDQGYGIDDARVDVWSLLRQHPGAVVTIELVRARLTRSRLIGGLPLRAEAAVVVTVR